MRNQLASTLCLLDGAQRAGIRLYEVCRFSRSAAQPRQRSCFSSLADHVLLQPLHGYCALSLDRSALPKMVTQGFSLVQHPVLNLSFVDDAILILPESIGLLKRRVMKGYHISGCDSGTATTTQYFACGTYLVSNHRHVKEYLSCRSTLLQRKDDWPLE